jgi:hypothetical protein
MSCDLRVSLAVKCSKANSDVTRVFRYPREHRRPATGTKTSPRARRRLIFGYQIVSGNYTESFKWDSGVGGKGCSISASAEVAMTKPNVANGSNNLELEATTEAIAPDKFRLHDVVSRPAASRGMIMYSDLLPVLPTHDEKPDFLRIIVEAR